MASITTRETGTTGVGGVTRKNLPLTNAEIDTNFININTAKLEITDTTENNVSGAVVKRSSSTGGFVAGPVQITSLGIGTAASGTTGEIRATNVITSYYSDERLKQNIELIDNALEKVESLRGVTYVPNSIAESFGYKKQKEIGVVAQDVEKVLPEAVKPAPFDVMLFEGVEISMSGENYKTVQYEKIVPLLIEAIKELNKEIKILKGIK
jgi:hypothetical protein